MVQILVTGATGFIGIEVVRRLNEEGVRPRVMVRREARAPLLAQVAAAGGPTVASVWLPHVYGPQSVLFGLVRRRLVVFHGRSDNRFAQLHVDDAAGVLVAAA